MNAFFSGKYKGIVVSVALFLLLDASVLLMNFYISFEIADDAEGVNIAGRQRMLSQRTMKSLLDIQVSENNPVEEARALAELKATTSLFNKTLNAFYYGGETVSATGKPIVLPAVTSSLSETAVKQAYDIWQPYWSKIDGLLAASKADDSVKYFSTLEDAIRFGSDNNLTLLKLMNDLTVDLEAVAASKATTLRVIQTVGISLAIINFFIIMFHFLRQLRESDQKIEAARQETTEILDTVNEGLFLLDDQLMIGDQHSAALSDIFQKENFGQMSLDELLGGVLSSKDMSTTHSFIGLLFKPSIKENLIVDLNPLNEVEVHLGSVSGNFESKFLSFSFSRVHSDQQDITHVLVTVVDITEKVKLAQELAMAKTQNEQQFSMLTKIIHTSSDLIQDYLKNSYQVFNDINQALMEPAKSQSQYVAKINHIYGLIHNYKGESSALSLDQFVDMAHKFEDELDTIKSRSNISGNDFLSLTVMLNQLLSQTEATQQLSDKLYHFGAMTGDASDGSEGTNSMVARPMMNWEHLHQLANAAAKDMDKQVEVVTSGLNDHVLAEPLHQVINQLTIQLVRNAVSHGIETTIDRELAQKPLVGKISIHLVKRSNGNFELTVKDDGLGFNVDTMRDVAMDRGVINEFEAEVMGAKEIIALIFTPDFSTKESVDKHAGRGIGMYSVKQLVKQWGGKISISSRRGQGCSFILSLNPLVGLDDGQSLNDMASLENPQTLSDQGEVA